MMSFVTSEISWFIPLISNAHLLKFEDVSWNLNRGATVSATTIKLDPSYLAIFQGDTESDLTPLLNVSVLDII